MPHIEIDRRFCGPPNSGNGGYVCGALARHVKGDSVEVTLQCPPPLVRTLAIRYEEGRVALLDADTVVAVARSVPSDIEALPSVSFDAAMAAASRPAITPETHLLPTCFVCGPERAEGDGMRLFAGPVEGYDALFAVGWVPDSRLPHRHGRPCEELVWAALDCPTGYAAYAALPVSMLLGRMTARVHALPSLGEKCVVTAKVSARVDRKVHVNGALSGEDGRCLAVARNTWIVVSPEVQKGTS